MATADPPDVKHINAELPPWLANHLNIEWNSDDVDALLASIDASQDATASTSRLLPAELLLLTLEYVPVEHLLDMRLVCRGFRDAIDGRVLYHHLQRTRLVGFLGSRSFVASMGDEAYEDLHLIYADFSCLEDERPETDRTERRALWASSHAVFKFERRWMEAHQFHAGREEIRSEHNLLSRLHISRNDQAYGALTWAIQLDSCVLDLDLPLEAGRLAFDVSVDLVMETVRVEWKPMLFRFLKTERALRLLMDEKCDSAFTFSHTEDCLRAIRRKRLHAALDPGNKIDRHIKWSLRLLQPLWGISGQRDPSTLDPFEHRAVRFLLLRRRAAALSAEQVAYLNQLAEDYKTVVRTVNGLARSVQDMQAQLVRRSQHDLVYQEVPQHFLDSERIPINPIAWPEKLRVDIETRVQKWKAQQDLIDQMQALMVVSQEALAVPDDAFDVMDSDF
ncbi:hypothetical protein E8E13_005886 [Curvularia kusanoi]|uniref:F-box domain-containing protein n=1 Tax=Curvularia kusanoi TaxID=90978 RepID=A0A9P4W8Z0_CURKU|nr:hypothetical protein E8E13_005886 [Curvularia kusanoi]